MNKLMTAQDVADLLRLTPDAVRDHCRKGLIGYIKINSRHYRFTESHIKEFLNSHNVQKRGVEDHV